MIKRSLLIRGIDNGRGDAHYQRGDVVDVFEYGKCVGREIKPPAFYVVHVGFATRAQADRLLQFRDQEDGDEVIGDDGQPQRPMVRKRAWNFLIDNLPAPAKSKLQATGELLIANHPQADYTWKQVRNFLRRKRDDAAAEDI